MIVKDRDSKQETTLKAKAGAKVEGDVAFYLKRQFLESKDIFVINDLRLSYKGEVAQIDHLILHSKGFVVVESKSIRGHVKVNKQLEWSRTVRGRWIGMPSPIEQA
ncbi:nuclease-related domain-containing protein [Vibrio sonorensis]|uniref:nuclease-related domain-containing protein n=1 Tax=Vibrio sonorensis TaxID=1004316 RepID=UPI001FDFB0D8|nr:nuclease-related domain-containing protein [Vibrio sonorensis]